MIRELISKVKHFDEDLADDLLDAIDEIRQQAYNDGWADRGDWGG